ncbi:MAG: adenosine kinase [Paracoccus sp. (in: a-proteobacteria)]|nr:adenosine kinase [Paracoccus sp. (in: a-proteobacteria)]
MKNFDVIGIGNAVVDVIASARDEDLDALGIQKGVMQLIERDRSETLLKAQAAMGKARHVPGGSVANTLAGIGRLGLETAFIGRVAADDLGRSYIEGTEAAGTRFVNAAIEDHPLPTSHSVILVTPDGERSMNTYLGISSELSPGDVPEGVFEGNKWLFLEGYLYDKAPGKEAFLRAADLCHRAGGRAGIALSDPFCVDRHRSDFRALIAGSMDFVIGNIHEYQSLYQTDDLGAALDQAAQECRLVVCTRSAEPALLIEGGQRTEIEIHPIEPVDLTGAGDQFAAGLLYGLASGRDLETAGRMGALAAAEVIAHVGPRPERDLLADFRAAGLV